MVVLMLRAVRGAPSSPVLRDETRRCTASQRRPSPDGARLRGMGPKTKPPELPDEVRLGPATEEDAADLRAAFEEEDAVVLPDEAALAHWIATDEWPAASSR